MELIASSSTFYFRLTVKRQSSDVCRSRVLAYWMQPKYHSPRCKNKQYSPRHQYESKSVRLWTFKASWRRFNPYIECGTRNSRLPGSWVSHIYLGCMHNQLYVSSWMILATDAYPLFQVLCKSAIDWKEWCLQFWGCSLGIGLWKKAYFPRRIWSWNKHCSLGMQSAKYPLF